MKTLRETDGASPKLDDMGVLYAPDVTPDYGTSFMLKGEDFIVDAAGALAGRLKIIGNVEAVAMSRFIKNNPSEALQALIDHDKLVLIVSIGGEVSVYSRMMRNRWPRKLVDFAEHYLSLFDDTDIAWYAHLDGDPVITQAGVATKGKKPVVDKPAVRSMRSREKSGLEHGGWTPESIVNTLLQ